MASNTTFFTPLDVIAINTLLTLEGAAMWIIQTAAPSSSKDRASGLKADGDEAAHVNHNARETVSLTYKCFATTGNLSLPKVGTVAGGYHIDSVALAYSPTDWPTLTVTVHKHGDGSTHADDSCRTYSTDIVFPAQFGVPALLDDNTPVTPVSQFAMAATGVGMRSLSFSLTCTHLDEQGGTGNWLAGENHDGVETLDAEFAGLPDDTDMTYAATWSLVTSGASSGNTTLNSRSVSLTRHIAKDV
jgi:hypothetical protein